MRLTNTQSTKMQQTYYILLKEYDPKNFATRITEFGVGVEKI
jgi:hypothetical protein